MTTKTFLIKDINCKMEVEEISRKEILNWLDDYINYIEFQDDETMFGILYKDGTEDVIDYTYDGHKIRRTNIQSIVFDNDCTNTVYGTYSINEWGVVTTSFETNINSENIELVSVEK